MQFYIFKVDSIIIIVLVESNQGLMIRRAKKQPGLGIKRAKKQGNKETAKKQLNKGGYLYLQTHWWTFNF